MWICGNQMRCPFARVRAIHETQLKYTKTCFIHKTDVRIQTARENCPTLCILIVFYELPVATCRTFWKVIDFCKITVEFSPTKFAFSRRKGFPMYFGSKLGNLDFAGLPTKPEYRKSRVWRIVWIFECLLKIHRKPFVFWTSDFGRWKVDCYFRKSLRFFRMFCK